LCLLVGLVGACSYDVGKLRSAGSGDGAVADSRGSPGQGDTSLDTNTGVAEVLPDLPISEDVAVVDDVAVTGDVDSASDVPLPQDSTDSRDLPFAGEVGGPTDVLAATDLGDDSDVPGGIDGPAGGTGGSGTGGATWDGGSTGGTDGGGTGGVTWDGGSTGGTGGGGMGGGTWDGGSTGGTDGGGTGGGGAGGSSVPYPDPDLVLWYKFDETSGTVASDSAAFGGVARNATLMTSGGGATALFSTVHQVGSHAVDLTPSAFSPSWYGGYVSMPSVSALAPDAITFAIWVYLRGNTSSQNWERIWDYGNSSTGNSWFCLTARAGDVSSGPVRFAMSDSGHTAASQQSITSPNALSPNVWHHVAIVLPAGATYTGIMYIDGVAVATKSGMTLHLSDMDTTSNNWLGRSEFSGSYGSDPYFNGLFDDYRIYRRALTQQEITDLYAVR